MREDGMNLRQETSWWLTKTQIFWILSLPIFLSAPRSVLQNITSMFDITASATGTFFINKSVIFKI